MNAGDRVRWVGNQHLFCAPGYNGTVLAAATKDPEQIKVLWDTAIIDEKEYTRRKGMEYTWERRKNLTHE